MTGEEVLAAAAHVRAADASVVLVGDAARIEPGLREVLGPVEIVRDPLLPEA